MHDTTILTPDPAADLRAALRRRIFAGLGLVALPACTVGSDPGGTSDAITATATGDASTSEVTPTTSPATGATTGDISSATTSADPGGTTAMVASESSGAPDPGTSTGEPPDTSTTDADATTTGVDQTTGAPDMTDVERCFSQVNGACPDLETAAMTYMCTGSFEEVLAWLEGPVVMGELCCYQVDVTAPGGGCIPGRPFVVDGRARVAPVRVGARGWQPRSGRREPVRRARGPGLPALAGLSPATRTRLGEAWAQDAAFEHASVASFARLALELMAFGAPAGLLRDVHAAAQSEVRHAALCFTLASAYLGAPVGPGVLPGAAAFTGAGTLAELAAAAVREGCVDETLAAAVAAAQHAAASDPAVRSVLAEVAADEGGHAELAYRIVAWALSGGDPEVRRSVQSAFHHALAELQREQDEDDEHGEPAEPADADLRAHGRFTRREVLAERRRAAGEIVHPAMRRLLGASH